MAPIEATWTRQAGSRSFHVRGIRCRGFRVRHGTVVPCPRSTTPAPNLLFGPSPVHPLARLSAHLGGEVGSGPSARTATPGSRSAATRCASSSTSSPTRSPRAATRWCRSAASSPTTPARSPAWPRHLGLGCVTVQEHWVDWPDVTYDRVGNIQLTRIMGGDVRLDPAGFDIGFRDSWQQALDRVEAAAARRTRSRPAPPTIRSAGSGSPTGRARSRPRSATRRVLRPRSSCAPSPARRTPA